MSDLFLRVAAVLLFLGCTIVFLTASAVSLVASVVRRTRTARVAAVVAATAACVWATALAAGPLLTPRRMLPLGSVLTFCSLDCHLHLRPATVQDGGRTIGVEAWSDARRAGEWPGLLRYRLVDTAGRRYPPEERVGMDMLGPGDSTLVVLRFPLPPGVRPAALEVTWGGIMDLLVPGPENTLVRRRSLVAMRPESEGGGIER